jgi:hypothetical protein
VAFALQKIEAIQSDMYQMKAKHVEAIRSVDNHYKEVLQDIFVCLI